jgi:hypothetical protein
VNINVTLPNITSLAVHPSTDSMRHDNVQRESIVQPPAVVPYPKETAVGSEKDRQKATVAAQHYHGPSHHAPEEQPDPRVTERDSQEQRHQHSGEQSKQQQSGQERHDSSGQSRGQDQEQGSSGQSSQHSSGEHPSQQHPSAQLQQPSTQQELSSLLHSFTDEDMAELEAFAQTKKLPQPQDMGLQGVRYQGELQSLSDPSESQGSYTQASTVSVDVKPVYGAAPRNVAALEKEPEFSPLSELMGIRSKAIHRRYESAYQARQLPALSITA